ncbi:STAS domain-containing protein [Polyangium mundeleinium]|uniref:STAS domain-containing protein n=1 Tax=Polyangium mundeleinium TaxID=2995306 RepID=A0ABT5F657_9BACT|nr:STAS domain-containing protein [Polyangium mundeleinium]MDC0748617.1 STAS domain-containing protein [Polyangium mundeleinium]
MSERPKISVDGVDFEWDRENGRILVWGNPALLMWIETTLAGLMVGIHKMVGTERFVIAAEQAGRESIEGEVAAIMQHRQSVEDGFRYLGTSAAAVGHGHWELVRLDHEKKEAWFRVHNSWEALYQKALGVTWGTSTMAGKFGAHCSRIFETHCRAEQTAFLARGDAYDEFVVRPTERTIEDDLDALIGTENATRADFTVAFERLQREVEERRRIEEDLRREVEERTRIEEELRSKLDLIRRQEEAIRAMSTPILKLWEGVLTMPVVGLVDSTRAGGMMEALLEEITRTQTRFTILDLTGVDVIDTGAAGHLLKVVQAARLLGTQCLVSGISPSMASTVVSLELDLGALKTFGTLEAALRYAIKQGNVEDTEAPKGGPRGVRSAR